MDKRSITSTELAAFARQLREQERAPGTIEKYIRDVSAASAWLRGAEVTRDGAAAWRDSLLGAGIRPRHRQIHGGGGKSVFHLSGLGGL